MTHHPRRSPLDGPRRLKLHAATQQRAAALHNIATAAKAAGRRRDTAPPAGGMIAMVRAQTALNERDRADRAKGGDGQAEPFRTSKRIQRYRTAQAERGAAHRAGAILAVALTVPQLRSIRRRAARLGEAV